MPMSEAVQFFTKEVVKELNKTIVVLDTETTGFSQYNDRIIEFGAIKLINGNKTIIQTTGTGDLKNVIYGIYGKDVAEGIKEVSYKYEDIAKEIGEKVRRGSTSLKRNRNV